MDTLGAIDYSSLSDEIRSMVCFAEQRYLTNISWLVTDEPEEATVYDASKNDFRPLTENEWDNVHHLDHNTAYLIVPLTRFREVTEVIPINREISARDVISKVYELYHTPLTKEKLDAVKSFPDSLGYTNNALKMAAKGKEVCYVDLRGAAIYFEGIQRVSGNVYKLHFGS